MTGLLMDLNSPVIAGVDLAAATDDPQIQALKAAEEAAQNPQGALDALGIETKPRIAEGERLERIRRSFKFGLRSAMELKNLWEGETLCIVGGAPSLESTFGELVDLVAAGAKVAAINKTHDWLIERGIVPTFGILCDPKDWVAGYMTPHPGVKYLIASQCHDDTFAAFEGVEDVYLWHAMVKGEDCAFLSEWAMQAGQSAYGVVGGSTSSLRAFDIGSLLLGFREARWFAVDSSADPNTKAMHPYEKPKEDPLLNRPIALLDPKDGCELAAGYWTTEPMWHQFVQFQIILDERRAGIRAGRYPKVRIAFHGTGLLPDWAALRGLHADPQRGDELRKTRRTELMETNFDFKPISETIEMDFTNANA